MDQDQFSEREQQLDQLYTFGIEFLTKIEDDICAQEDEISNLQDENKKYKDLHDKLKKILDGE